VNEKQSDAVEYLQTAAIEAIKAMRAFLDVAEGLVREPETAVIVGRAFAEAATSAMRPNRSNDDEQDDGDVHEGEEEHTGRLRRINLSD
jgi:hypothetical protein